MLSNTAVPRYYGEFRQKVIEGKIPVCATIAMEMNRIDALIADPNVYYDDDAINGFIAFCENELTLTDGSDLHLLDSFKLWSEQIFGWYEFVVKKVPVPNKNGRGVHYEERVFKRRLIHKQYLIVARGAAKSMYASLLQAYFLIIDTSTTYQITTSPTMKQSEEVMSPLKTAITRSKGPLFQFLTYGSIQNTTGSKADRVKLASTKKGIESFVTGSLLEIRPMSIDKLQGLRCKVATVDEWLSGEIREDPIGAIEQGASKIDDYLIVAISSEGTVRNGVGDSMKMELMKILKGDYVNKHISIFHYQLDSIDEVADPSKWIKANPNIGITVSYDTYQQDVERAEQNPSVRNDIIAKRFGIPMEGYTYAFTYEETIPKTKFNCDKMLCALGADLSRGDDFCAFTFVFPHGDGSLSIKTRSYITRATFDRLPAATKIKYKSFEKEGTLVIMEGVTLSDKLDTELYDDLDEFIESHGYQVCALGYDPYNAKEFISRWQLENGPYGVYQVIQGSKTESVPLGDLKNLAEHDMLIFDETLMSFCMGNAIILTDTNGNRKLYKPRADKKIDNVAALMDAYVAMNRAKDAFK